MWFLILFYHFGESENPRQSLVASTQARKPRTSRLFCATLKTYCATHFSASSLQRPGNGSGPQVALAWDTMTDPGERVCHKSKPMHQQGTPETSPFGVALGPEATTLAPAPQSSPQRCSPDVFPTFLAKPNVAKAGSAEGSGTPTSGSHVAAQALQPFPGYGSRQGPATVSGARLVLCVPTHADRNEAPERPGK